MRQYKLYEGKGNDCLTLENVDKPVIKRSTDVLVKVHALSLNARDHQFSNGIYALPLPKGGAVPTSGEQSLFITYRTIELEPVSMIDAPNRCGWRGR